MKTLIHSATGVSRGVHDDLWILMDPGGILARGSGDGWRSHDADIVIDARELAGEGVVLTPGFLDLHGHGGGGSSYDDGAEAILAARALHRAHGTTRAVISLVTASLPALAERVGVIAALTEQHPDILGSHLEGPFLDPGHKGAHEETLLVPPRAGDLAALIAAARGTLRQITLAPELPGGLDAVRAATAVGAVAAVGHTDADAAMAHAAFDAGARLVTHAFNAMPGIHHRAPGPVVAAVSDERVALELIADGVHVDLELVRMMFDAAPGRIVLVTDAMAAAGSADGEYPLGGLSVSVRDGVARLTGTETIAGSTLTQDRALRNVVTAGVPLTQAVAALTETPARVLGRDDLGRLDIGCAADAVLLDAALEVRAVWAGGERAL